MDSRERTFLSLSFQEPDRVPIDFWISRAARARLERVFGTHLAAFLDAHDVDLRYIAGPRYIGPPLRTFPDGSSEDIWGVRRVTAVVPVADAAEEYEELLQAPLSGAQTVEQIERYPGWPSPDWFDYAQIAQQCLAVREQGRVAVFMGDRLNRVAQLKPAMYLRGMELIYEDMALRPELAGALFHRIRAFYSEYLGRILEAAKGTLDILLTGDDFGGQNAPLVSPRMWLEQLAPGFAGYMALARAYGVRTMHHTCGAVHPLIPLMLQRGLEILQSLQPEAAGMEARALKAAYGGRLAFQGGISVQRTLPFGTPEDVRREVRERIAALAPGGGYILCTSHNIQADTPLVNITALLQAYREFGRYH